MQDMDEDIRPNGWGIKKIGEVSDAQELMKIFQDFYTLMGRLPLSKALLVVPDGDALSGEKLNMKHLYDLFKNTKSHGIVPLPFLGLIQYYLEENDHSLTKNATTELYYNLSYMTLSGARDFKFDAVSELIARLSILLKHATLRNKRMREVENQVLAKSINDDRIFEPKIEDPLDDVIEIIDQNIKNLCIHILSRQFKRQTKSTKRKNLLTTILSTCRPNSTRQTMSLQNKRNKRK